MRKAARVATVFYFVVCAIVLPLCVATVLVNGVQLFTAISSPNGEKIEQFNQGNKLLYNTKRLVDWSRDLRRAGAIGIVVLLASGGVMLLIRRAAGQPAP